MLGSFIMTEAADLEQTATRRRLGETRSFKDDMKEDWYTLRQSRTSKKAQKCLVKCCGMDVVHSY